MDDPSPYIEREQKKEGSIGPLSAMVVIVTLVIVGGVYFLIQQERHAREMRLQEEQIQLPLSS